MDKVEYRELIRNIKSKYLQKDYEGVIEISDQLDPEKIKENSILEIIAKAYEVLGRSDLAKEVLLIAYKRTPTGKRIAYNLAMLCIKLEDLDGAVMFYEDFCKMAPKDNQRLLLKYEIGKAGGISVSELAKVLENYNSREMDDKWEYELARLYHEMGDDEKCAAACDQIILWYANGEYEKKALELKNMHKALTPAQQARYEELMKNVIYPVSEAEDSQDGNAPEGAEPAGTVEILEEDKLPGADLIPVEEPSEETDQEDSVEERPEDSSREKSMEDVMAGIAENVEAARAEEEATADKTSSDAEQQPEEETFEEERLPEIDYETTHLAPQTYTEEAESEDEEIIAGQLSLSAMFDAFRNQTTEDRAQMNKVGEDRAAQIMAEVNDTHDSSILKQFDKDEDDNEPVGEIFEPEVPLLNRDDVTEPVDDGGEDLGERAAEFAFEKAEEKEEEDVVRGKESSVDATQFIPVAEITAQISDEAREELEEEGVIPPSVVGETSVYEEIDPGSAAGKVDVGSAATEEPNLDMEELMDSIEGGEEPEEIAPEETAPEETVPEETAPEETAPEESVPEESVPEKEPEKEFVLDLIFGNSVIPPRRKKEKKVEPVVEEAAETVEEAAEGAEETVEETAEGVEAAVEEATEGIEEAVEATAEEAAAEATEAVGATVEAVEATAEEAAETVEEAAKGVEETVEEAAEGIEEAAETAQEAAEAVVEAAEATAEEVAEAVEEAAETAEANVEDAEATAEEVAEGVEETAEDTVEEAAEAVEEATPELIEPEDETDVLKGDLFVSRTRAQEDAVLNGGFNFRNNYKKKETTAGSGAKEEARPVKSDPVKTNKEKLREEKKKEKALRKEMQQEDRLRKEEERIEKLRAEQQRKERLQAEKKEKERLQAEQEEKERLLEEQRREELRREEQLREETRLAEELAEEPLTEEQIPEEQVQMEESGTEDQYEDEIVESEESASFFHRGISKIGGFFHSLFKKENRKEFIEEEDEEITDSEPEDENSILDELMETAFESEEETEDRSSEEEQEEEVVAAAAETIEKLKEFVAKEENEETENEETEDEEEQEQEKPEDEPDSVPVMKKPEKNPEADAAAAAALERFRQLSVKEKEEEPEEESEPEPADGEEKKKDSGEELSVSDFIEPEIEQEPVYAEEEPAYDEEEEPKPVRSRREQARAAKAARREAEQKPLRGNKVYKGNKEPRGNKGNKKKKEKHMKSAVQFGDELFAEVEGNKQKKKQFDIDGLLDETVQSGQSAGRKPINEESLNELLSTSIDPSKPIAEAPKKEPEPERELAVSEAGEFDLDGFIQKDKPTEDPKQMSFDDLFGGEFRPKVRVPAEATSRSATKKLVLNKKYKLSKEQRKALGEFLMIDGMEEEICGAIDNLITKKKAGDETGGHMIVTGDAKSGKTFLTIEILKAVNQEVGHGNPRVAKVQAQAINGKNIRKILSKVADSDLIIENIGKLEDATARDIISAVRENDAPTMVILEGNELAADTLIQKYPDLVKVFKTRIDIGELTLTQWGDIAQRYAQSQGYSIDGAALLALHARIDKINTSDVKLGFSQVKSIVDEAIEKTEKHGSGKLFSAFAGKIEDSLIPLPEDSF